MTCRNLSRNFNEAKVFDWLTFKVDDSIFNNTDLYSRIMIRQIEECRINKEIDVILCRCFIGGRDGRQLSEFTAASNRAKLIYESRGIKLLMTFYDQDSIKNIEKWTPTDLTDHLLEADFHIMVTHLHEGNIAKNGSWNIPNILSNLDRLKYHQGNLMGAMNSCPIYRQGKREVYECLQDHCLPTLIVNLPSENWDGVHPITKEDTAKVYA